MKKPFLCILMLLLSIFIFYSFTNLDTIASEIGSGSVGIENKWGIGYKIKDHDTIPLLAFDQPGEPIREDNSEIAQVNKDYVAYKDTVNIHVNDIKDLFFVVDLYYGIDDNETFNYRGLFNLPINNPYFFNFSSSDEIFNSEIEDTNAVRVFDLDENIEINDFEGMTTLSQKSILFNFETMVVESKRDQNVFEFKLLFQNSGSLLHKMDARRRELNILVVVDNEKPNFYPSYNQNKTENPIDTSKPIYVKDDFVFRVYDKVNDNSNQVSRYTCTKDGEACLNMPLMPQGFTEDGFVPEIRLSENGSYVLEIDDLAGNTNSLQVVIDKNGPIIESFIENETERNIINNGAYSKGITLKIIDSSLVNDLTVAYKYNDVRQDDIQLDSDVNTIDDMFINNGKYEILFVEDFLGNRAVFSNNSESITFFIDNLGPFFDGNVELLNLDDVKYNTSNVRLKFFDDEFGSGLFTTTYYQIVDGVEIVKTLPNQDILGYYLFSQDAHHKVIIKDKALNEIVLEFIIDKTPPSFDTFLNQNVIYLESTTNLSVLDSVSGLKLSDSTIKFNNQTQPTTLLELNYEIQEEGKYTFNLTDYAGNESEIIVYLDRTKPTLTTQAILNNVEKEYYNQAPFIIYSDGDYGSGIKSYFRFINNQWIEIQKRDVDGFFVNRVSGLYQFKVIDYLNNESDILTINFDQTKPILNSNLFIIEELNYFNTFDLTFSVIEDYSGLKEIKIYEYDNTINSYVLKYSSETSIDDIHNILDQEKEGKYKIEVIDHALNKNTYELYFDTQAPILINIENASYITNWTDNFNLYFEDENSGINNIEVSYEDQAYGPFLSFLTLIQEGQYRFKVYDNAGNVSEFTLYYDFANPVIEGVVPNSISNERAILIFEDSYSGFDFAEIKLNDELIESMYTNNTYAPLEDGSYEIIVYDVSGRSSTVSFIYDSTPPLIETEFEMLEEDNYVFSYISSEEIELIGVMDSSSTIQQTTYTWNGEIKELLFPINLSQGTHVIELEDLAGNRSLYTFIVDTNDLPYLSQAGNVLDSEFIYISQITEFIAIDDLSGIQSLTINDVIQSSNSFSLNQNGTYVISLIDNSNLMNEYTIIYDDIQPVYEINLIEGVLRTSRFSVYDLESGVDNVEYRQDMASPWIKLDLNNQNEGFILDNGQYYIRVFDKAGNMNEISFIADIVYPNVIFDGTLYSKVNNLLIFTSEVSIDFSENEDFFSVTYYDATNLDEMIIENNRLTLDGKYLVSVTNEFDNTLVYKIIIDQTPIQIEVLENTFFNQSYSLEFGDDVDDISRLIIRYCENFLEATCLDVSNDYLLEDTIQFDLEGKYHIEVYDEYENQSSTSFTIDKSKPTLTLIGEQNITLEYLEDYIEFGADVNDNFDTDILIHVIGSVDVTTLGTYIIEYQAEDISGNKADTIYRTVEVKDSTPPVIEINGDAVITLEAGTDYVELGAKVIDNYDEDIIAVVGGDRIDTTKLGTYIITYDYTDSNNNRAVTSIREVTIVDTVHPEIQILNQETNEPISVSNSGISINHGFIIEAFDNGSGIKSIYVNGILYTDIPILLSGEYLIEALDFANNSSSFNILLDMVPPTIRINSQINLGLEIVNIFGVNEINCSDTLSSVQCYVNNILFEDNNFQLYLPGIYQIKAVDELGNASTVNIKISLPFNQVKSLFWYEFDNIKFKEIIQILEYVKFTSKYEFQMTDAYSFNELTTLRYDIREIPSDKTVKSEYLLIIYNSQKYAFLTEQKLDEVITNFILQDVEKKYYNSITSNFYEFENDFYVNTLSDLNQLHQSQMEIRSMQGNTIFEGILIDDLDLPDQRYRIIIKDERFNIGSTYDFYLTIIEEKNITFKIKNLDKEELKILNDGDTLQYKNNIEVEIGDYPFDITVEIFEYNSIEEIGNTLLDTFRYQITSGSILTIGNSENSNVLLENNKAYTIKIYYIESINNTPLSKTVQLNLIDPNIPSIDISPDQGKLDGGSSKFTIIRINEDTIDLYYITEVYIEYCKVDNCDSPERLNIEFSIEDNKIEINQDNYKDKEGYYRVVVKDNLNEIHEGQFLIQSSGITPIQVLVGLVIIVALFYASIALINKLRESKKSKW